MNNKKCPYCGSMDTVLIGPESYRCKACLKNFETKKVNSTNKSNELNLNGQNRKIFFDRLLNKVVELRAFFDNEIVAGTGFFISSKYILTNAHVVSRLDKNQEERYTSIRISGNNYNKNKSYEFEIISIDDKKDIAILEANQENKDFAKFAGNIYIGEQLFAIGNSRGEGICIVEGIVSDISRIINSNEFFMTSAIVTNGNSGCPVFNTEGYILGMITEGSRHSVAMNYAIPVSVLTDFIKQTETENNIKIL